MPKSPDILEYLKYFSSTWLYFENEKQSSRISEKTMECVNTLEPTAKCDSSDAQRSSE